MDTNRACWSTSHRIHVLGLSLMLAALPAPLLAQSASPPAAADSTSAPAAPPAAAPATPAAPVRVLTCADGERDADSQHDPLFYGLGGALTGPFGVGFAMMKRPEPPLTALAGQTPSAATEYTRCFAARARRKNIKAAANGFAITAMAALVAVYYMDSKTAP